MDFNKPIDYDALSRMGIPTPSQEALQPDPKWDFLMNMLSGGVTGFAQAAGRGVGRALLTPSRGAWSAKEFSRRLTPEMFQTSQPSSYVVSPTRAQEIADLTRRLSNYHRINASGYPSIKVNIPTPGYVRPSGYNPPIFD